MDRITEVKEFGGVYSNVWIPLACAFRPDSGMIDVLSKEEGVTTRFPECHYKGGKFYWEDGEELPFTIHWMYVANHVGERVVE